MNGVKNEKKISSFDTAISCLSANLRSSLIKVSDEIKFQAQEVRVRINNPIVVRCPNRAYFITKDGRAINLPEENMLSVSQTDIMQSFNNICNYSVYSYQNEIKNGFITIKGGHRVGIVGKVIVEDGQLVNPCIVMLLFHIA